MAGDWIKFEKATSDKPEVWQVADRLDMDPDAVVGKLLRVWSWFDDHTESGNAPSVTKRLLDREVGVRGFCDCVIDAGWMREDEEGIHLPNFERHNGETAKKRALTAKRAAKHRGKSNAESNGDSVTSALPREEKRREDNKPPKSPKGDWPRFDDFWSVYPRKHDKAKALKAWNKLKPDDQLVETMLASLSAWARSEQWTKDSGQFVPLATTWLNGARWEDELPKPPPAGGGAPRQIFPGPDHE